MRSLLGGAAGRLTGMLSGLFGRVALAPAAPGGLTIDALASPGGAVCAQAFAAASALANAKKAAATKGWLVMACSRFSPASGFARRRFADVTGCGRCSSAAVAVAQPVDFTVLR
jgi:hypothetical protein